MSAVLRVPPPDRANAVFNKVTRGLESRTIEARGARRFRAISGPPQEEGLDWSRVMWRRTKDMWTGEILEGLHVDGKPQGGDLMAEIPGDLGISRPPFGLIQAICQLDRFGLLGVHGRRQSEGAWAETWHS